MSKTAIVNCFHEANIFVNVQAITVNDEDDPCRELNADPDELWLIEPFSCERSWQSKFSREQTITALPLTDEEILEEVIIDEIEADDDLDDEFDV